MPIDISPTENSSDGKIEIKFEEIQPQTTEEIMAESDVSFHDLMNDDHQIESTELSQSSIKDRNLQSMLSFSDDEISSEQLENELANMQTKSKNIEEMIDKFLSNS